MKTRILSTFLVLLIAGVGQAETLSESVTAFSGKVSKYLEFHRETDLFVMPIQGPSRLGNQSPNSIRQMFQDSLRNHKIAGSASARIRLSARASHVFDSAGRVRAIQINGVLVDAFDEVLFEFNLTADPGNASPPKSHHFVSKQPPPTKPTFQTPPKKPNATSRDSRTGPPSSLKFSSPPRKSVARNDRRPQATEIIFQAVPKR